MINRMWCIFFHVTFYISLWSINPWASNFHKWIWSRLFILNAWCGIMLITNYLYRKNIVMCVNTSSLGYFTCPPPLFDTSDHIHTTFYTDCNHVSYNLLHYCLRMGYNKNKNTFKLTYFIAWLNLYSWVRYVLTKAVLLMYTLRIDKTINLNCLF